MTTRRSTAGAFTLIELLVVIAIIMILASILVPGINKAIIMGHVANSRSAIRELSAGAHSYESEYGCFPGQERPLASNREGKVSLVLGECLWGNTGTPINKYLPFKEDKVMGTSLPNSRIPSDRFPDAMALLYYPSRMGATGNDVADCFYTGDNSSLPGSPSLTSYASEAKNSALGKPYHYDTFLIIGAGADREYFTEDDVTNWR